MADTAFSGLVMRSGRVAFMELASGTKDEFERMTHFTQMNKTMNPQEYSRNYVDVPSEITDVTGYSPNIEYAFDRYTGDHVQDDIVSVYDEEKTGTDAVRRILVVDMKSGVNGIYDALMRSYSIIPDTEGDGTDAYTYSGSFVSNSEQKKVSVRLNDDLTKATLVKAEGMESETEVASTRGGRYR